MELLIPGMCCTATWNSCCAAMKYSDHTSDMMCGCLVEPLFHMSTTVLLSQWNSMDLPLQQ